jgi:RHS repeat-associated protein
MVLTVKLNPAAGASQDRPQSAIASYVWRPDLGSQPFARRNWQAAGGVRGLVMANYFTGANGGGIHLPVMDAMGNVTQVVRAGVQLNYNGDSMRSEFVYDYDAFGKETRSSTLVAGLNPGSFPFHYSTKFTDPESGFNYYGYRFYDPSNGRWPNRDPIGENGGLNLYGMVGNNIPIEYDKLGLCGDCKDLELASAHAIEANAINGGNKTGADKSSENANADLARADAELTNAETAYENSNKASSMANLLGGGGAATGAALSVTGLIGGGIATLGSASGIGAIFLAGVAIVDFSKQQEISKTKALGARWAQKAAKERQQNAKELKDELGEISDISSESAKSACEKLMQCYEKNQVPQSARQECIKAL